MRLEANNAWLDMTPLAFFRIADGARESERRIDPYLFCLSSLYSTQQNLHMSLQK
jgi:hypothetical protein